MTIVKEDKNLSKEEAKIDNIENGILEDGKGDDF